MEILKFTRKVHPIGKSYLVTLPKEWARRNEIRKGTVLSVYIDNFGRVIITPEND